MFSERRDHTTSSVRGKKTNDFGSGRRFPQWYSRVLLDSQGVAELNPLILPNELFPPIGLDGPDRTLAFSGRLDLTQGKHRTDKVPL